MDNQANLSSPVGWTDAQWNRVYQAVTDEASKASVAGAFLPCYGPMSRSTEVVRFEEVVEPARGVLTSKNVLKVNDDEPIKLWTLAVHVELKQQQLADENLASAIVLFRRAANILARTEDTIVFRGLSTPDPSAAHLLPLEIPSLCRVTGGQPTLGLVELGTDRNLQNVRIAVEIGPTIGKPTIEDSYYGQAIVKQISISIGELEKQGNLGPFSCILGDTAFVQIYTPEPRSLVLPKDLIEPLLDGPVMRSSAMKPYDVIVVSLAGDLIDLVVATAPTVQFLNVTDEARYVFRVYERFAMRVKQQKTVRTFNLKL